MPGDRPPSPAGTAAPRWTLAWAVLLAVVQTWHAAAALTAPASLPGGALAWLGLPFQGYLVRFAPYSEPGNGFLLATTLLDLLEVVIVLAGLLLLARRDRRGSLLVAAGLLMYAYKVVVVVSVEAASGYPSLPGVSAGEVAAWYLATQLGMAAVSAVAGLSLLRPWWSRR